MSYFWWKVKFGGGSFQIVFLPLLFITQFLHSLEPMQWDHFHPQFQGIQSHTSSEVCVYVVCAHACMCVHTCACLCMCMWCACMHMYMCVCMWEGGGKAQKFIFMVQCVLQQKEGLFLMCTKVICCTMQLWMLVQHQMNIAAVGLKSIN